MKRTDENVANGRLPGFFVGQKVLVGLETGESDRHLRYDTRKNGTEALVKRQWRLSLNNLDSCSDEPSWFRLSSCNIRTRERRETTPA